jgi:glutamate-1-semialdehyde 2,1-aminomutase
MLVIERTFRERTPRSADHAAAAARVMPGGDTRAAGHHPPYQLTLVRGEGPWLTDVDGHRYLDLIGNFTSLVHGNAYPPIIAAARRAMEDGTNWPARNVHAVALAEEIVARVPSVEQLRFTNSGSEATMLAVEIARVATGRRLVLMARYGYHGSAPHFEVGTHGHEGPETLVATYGEAAEFTAILAERGEHIAAVILEPVMGSGGLLAASADFLVAVQQAARAAGALVILDEVITLRLSTGGAQQVLGVRPDLTAMGKIIGGGFPVGAVGGREELLALCDPSRPRLFHSGTFNGNPVTTAAGLVSLQHLDQGQIDAMSGRADGVEVALAKAAADAGLPLSVRRAGSMLQLFFSPSPPAATPLRTDGELITAFHLAALNHGVFLAPRGLLALSTVLDDGHLEDAGTRLSAAVADVAAAT